jgi:ATP-dependent DNA helicase DinG
LGQPDLDVNSSLGSADPAFDARPTEISELFATDGPLAQVISGFRSRPQQIAMAKSVAAALENNSTLICEAGTGTGKTLAYLLPALLCDRRVLISTATRNLQDQLYDHDLPLLRKVVRTPFKAALLKGRSNYVCHHRLDQARGEPGLDAELQHQRHAIEEWLQSTVSGDTAELSRLPEDSPIWPLVTSTIDNCLGQECSHYDQCFVVKARRYAQDSDVVVVNHHLLLADLALREEGFGELLPGMDAIIVDEAHQLAETASVFFSATLSSRQLQDLVRDATLARIAEAKDAREIDKAALMVEGGIKRLRTTFSAANNRVPWHQIETRPAFQLSLERLGAALSNLHQLLEFHSERGKRLGAALRRCDVLKEKLVLFNEIGDQQSQRVRWIELRGRGFLFHATPVELGTEFQRRSQSNGATWLFVSATLAVQGRFDHFEHQLGIEDAEHLLWDSPYDYRKQSLLYFPGIAHEPNDPRYLPAFLAAALPVLQASRGRAFMLFTSHRALQEAHGFLKQQIDFPLFVQGKAPRSALLEGFRRAGNAVLLGTSSFWEGVDVRGDALSCVIIDRLPFAAPDDPVLQARNKALRERGLNPFWEDQLPAAVIALKQGVGRLIRDEDDRGVLMIGDPRIRTRRYGRAFLDSLPPMRRTEDLQDVQAFFNER